MKLSTRYILVAVLIFLSGAAAVLFSLLLLFDIVVLRLVTVSYLAGSLGCLGIQQWLLKLAKRIIDSDRQSPD